MPSKGVQAYTYIAAPGCSIELSVPGQTVVKDQLHQFWNGDLEVESSKIDSFFDKTGRFVFKVLHGGRLITEQWVEVNALTGNVVSTSPLLLRIRPACFKSSRTYHFRAFSR